jgi:hypothetical protein
MANTSEIVIYYNDKAMFGVCINRRRILESTTGEQYPIFFARCIDRRPIRQKRQWEHGGE